MAESFLTKWTRVIKATPLSRPEATVVTVRNNPDESIDEIFAKGCNVHIEQMDDTGYYVGIDEPDGSYWQFWIGAKNGRSHVTFRATETPERPKR